MYLYVMLFALFSLHWFGRMPRGSIMKKLTSRTERVLS